MANVRGTLCIGVTNDLERRVFEHKLEKVKGFTQKYSCHKLVYYEEYEYICDAIAREKQIKNWSRKKKEKLIRILNPLWQDLGGG